MLVIINYCLNRTFFYTQIYETCICFNSRFSNLLVVNKILVSLKYYRYSFRILLTSWLLVSCMYNIVINYNYRNYIFQKIYLLFTKNSIEIFLYNLIYLWVVVGGLMEFLKFILTCICILSHSRLPPCRGRQRRDSCMWRNVYGQRINLQWLPIYWLISLDRYIQLIRLIIQQLHRWQKWFDYLYLWFTFTSLECQLWFIWLFFSSIELVSIFHVS